MLGPVALNTTVTRSLQKLYPWPLTQEVDGKRQQDEYVEVLRHVRAVNGEAELDGVNAFHAWSAVAASFSSLAIIVSNARRKCARQSRPAS
jgi:hypothetical protein